MKGTVADDRRAPTTPSSAPATRPPAVKPFAAGGRPIAWAEQLRNALVAALDRRKEAGDNPRQIRRLARRSILIAANTNRIRLDLPPYNTRQIQQAVRAVRHNQLVDQQTLIDAGYRPHNK